MCYALHYANSITVEFPNHIRYFLSCSYPQDWVDNVPDLIHFLNFVNANN
jgi:hypothetical protein